MNNNTKSHLNGGTLRKVMAQEIQRVLDMVFRSNTPQPVETAALILGITPRTLYKWRGPVDKGGWEELQPDNVVEKFMAKGKKAVKKPFKKKTSNKPKKPATVPTGAA